MRTFSDAGLPPWPLRIFRPWFVASFSGASIGAVLLVVSASPASEENSYAEHAPRAAVYEASGGTGLAIDPFAPASSLAAPPDAPEASAPAPSDISAPAEVSSAEASLVSKP